MQRSFSGLTGFAAVSIAISLSAHSAGLAQVTAVAEESVPSSVKGAPATHKQQKILTVAKVEAGEKLEDFCLDSKGRILALLGPNDQGAGISLSAIAGIFSKKGAKFESAVHVYDAEGSLVSK